MPAHRRAARGRGGPTSAPAVQSRRVHGSGGGEVVAAAFGCFNPKVVVPAVEAGWQVTSREAILEDRERAATAMLQRVVGDQPAGLDRVTELLRRAAAAARWEARPIFALARLPGRPARCRVASREGAPSLDNRLRSPVSDVRGGPQRSERGGQAVHLRKCSLAAVARLFRAV